MSLRCRRRGFGPSKAIEYDPLSSMSAGEPYEIVFVDWQMPGIDGIETGKRIRAIERGLRAARTWSW